MLAAILLVGLVAGLGGAVDLQAKYPFSAVLFDEQGQYYELHWNFTRSTESIYFAVNVSTTGWVGFGISPNGQMPGSDVVIGWVSNAGQSYFHDRYAEGRFLPPIDTLSQDWFLTNSEEQNGFTVLEFSRNFTTCDPQDLDITSSTARVVWSFNSNDPTDPTGSDAAFHDYKGSRSVNLLGGQPTNAGGPAEGTPFLDIEVTDVTIPSDSTTYWCESFRLPSELINTTHYINRISPVITPHPTTFVHHMLIYLCNQPLANEDVGVSASCNGIDEDVSACRGGLLVGAWAVGGEDFIYPEGISYPVGGVGQEHFAVIEIHYDNPGRVSGEVDSSGLRFYYTTEPAEQRAGILFFGHRVTPIMLVPPRTKNYTIAGICSADCTNQFIPEEGIRIIGDLLHTHLVGRGLTIEHYRYNSECGGLEELEPIDQNLNYDFNFQQFTFLPKEHLVLPGDILVLKCYYDTTANSDFVTGGESTIEEMCLSFPVFYPRPADGNILSNCVSFPDTNVAFNDFATYLGSVNLQALQDLIANPADGLSIFNGLDWAGNPELAVQFQDSILNSAVSGVCVAENGRSNYDVATEGFPKVTLPTAPECPYVPADKCSESPAGALPQTQISVVIGSFMLLLSMLVAVL